MQFNHEKHKLSSAQPKSCARFLGNRIRQTRFFTPAIHGAFFGAYSALSPEKMSRFFQNTRRADPKKSPRKCTRPNKFFTYVRSKKSTAPKPQKCDFRKPNFSLNHLQIRNSFYRRIGKYCPYKFVRSLKISANTVIDFLSKHVKISYT